MNNKDFCLQLLYSESEDEIIKILKKENYWQDSNSWKCFGDNENNFATIGNQQSRPEAALTEKIINSVDAVLMSECLKKGINPESKDAPQSIQEALIKYFDIYEGKLSFLDINRRRKLSENIILTATGERTKPCYSIIDKGEGQTPLKMPNTLLSLAKSNKLRIPFVQGKFNQGGTGVFLFCGENNFQLIISKRHPDIAKFENDESKEMWGFTIIRRVKPTGGIRSSIYKYLAPNGKILSFKSDSLKILPGAYPNPYENNLNWGTCIKMYEYQLPSSLKTIITLDLYNKLSLLLPSIALPIRLYERRPDYKAHTPETTLSGLTVRLDEDKRKNIEDNFPTSFSFNISNQSINGSIYVFKRDISKGKELSEKYTNDEGIIFLVNGQTHGYLSKNFFVRNSVKMSYLKDSILVIVDCSKFESRYIEDLFMTSRDRLRNGKLRLSIEKQLEDILCNHPGLKELRLKRRKEDIEDKLKDSKPLKDIVENIIKNSPTLSKLFIDGVKISNPFKVEGSGKSNNFIGEKFPTFFNLIEKHKQDNPKYCYIKSKFRLQYKTDAENDYFNRDIDPGKFELKFKNILFNDFWINLWNGIATLTVNLPENAKENDIYTFESIVSDINNLNPYKEEFVVEVTGLLKNKNGKCGKRKPPSSNDKGKDSNKQSNLDLPNIIEVYRERWEKNIGFIFNEESALFVIDSGDSGYDFYVNMDNKYLLHELKFNINTDEKLLKARYKFGIVLLGLGMLKEYIKNNDDDSNTENNIDIFQIISKVSTAISPILLPMISSLGSLEIEEAE